MSDVFLLLVSPRNCPAGPGLLSAGGQRSLLIAAAAAATRDREQRAARERERGGSAEIVNVNPDVTWRQRPIIIAPGPSDIVNVA